MKPSPATLSEDALDQRYQSAVWKSEWQDAIPMELEPYFTHWITQLTEQGLHSKADIATVLAILSYRIARCREAFLETTLSEIAPMPDHFEGPGTMAAALKPNERYLRAALPAKYHDFYDKILLPLAQRGAESMRPSVPSATPRKPDEILAEVIKDIRGRMGLRQEWDGIDVDTRNEIIATWRGFFK